MLVILFGQFHGLVFLPVILSVVGPQPYEIVDRLSGDEMAACRRKENGATMEGDDNEMTTLQHQNGTGNGTNLSIKL